MRRPPQRLDPLPPHGELLHLSSNGHWEFVHQPDVTRDLEVRDFTFAEGTDIRFAGSGTLFQPQPGTQFLAETIVRHAEHPGGEGRAPAPPTDR